MTRRTAFIPAISGLDFGAGVAISVPGKRPNWRINELPELPEIKWILNPWREDTSPSSQSLATYKTPC